MQQRNFKYGRLELEQVVELLGLRHHKLVRHPIPIVNLRIIAQEPSSTARENYPCFPMSGLTSARNRSEAQTTFFSQTRAYARSKRTHSSRKRAT